MGIINNKRVAQNAQEPSKRVGSGQTNRVPSHEGSQLGSPSKAKVSKGGNIVA
jgi:hypothetical protein